MRDSAIGVYTIGQTPRPDLTDSLAADFSPLAVEVRGALDGIEPDRIPAPDPDGYPLETLLRDGSSRVVDAEFVEPLLQQAIDELDDRVVAHLILCAGVFPELRARHPVVQPFEVTAAGLAGGDWRSLEIVVPFAAQEEPAADKWDAAGFQCRTHVLDAKPAEVAVDEWLLPRVEDSLADALVFDYVGYPFEVLMQVQEGADLPVLDLGQVAIQTVLSMIAAGDLDVDEGRGRGTRS